MLTLNIKAREFWNEKTNEFEYVGNTTVKLEHSLLSISKWESKWKKPFITDKYEKTDEMWLDYIRCMAITPITTNELLALTPDDIQTIMDYINDSQTATWFKTNPLGAPANPTKKKDKTPTSELIYYWMFSYQIPKDCEKWHINRLLTLIRVFSVENTPPEKLSKKQMASRRSALNAARLKKYGKH